MTSTPRFYIFCVCSTWIIGIPLAVVLLELLVFYREVQEILWNSSSASLDSRFRHLNFLLLPVILTVAAVRTWRTQDAVIDQRFGALIKQWSERQHLGSMAWAASSADQNRSLFIDTLVVARRNARAVFTVGLWVWQFAVLWRFDSKV